MKNLQDLAASNSISASGALELRKRFFFTLLALFVYRIGTYIPLPGIDPHILQDIAQQNSGGILGMFNVFAGGALERMTIFALNIMPYITASIAVQLLTIVIKRLEDLKKEGERGRKVINQYTRYLTIGLTALQGYGIALWLETINTGAGQAVVDPGAFFRLTVVVTLIGGTAFLMWLGEQVTSRGLGNGISLIIFTGIVAELPSAIGTTFSLSWSGQISVLVLLAILALALGVMFLIVFCERAQRRIVVQYPKRQRGNKLYAGDATHIPLKLNMAGVIPAIFASALLLFPLTLAGLNKYDTQAPWLDLILTYFAHGRPAYILCYIAFIMFFCFFYTAIVFNPVETADMLKRNGGFIPGRRPGKHTAEFLDYVVTRLTAAGAIYLAFVCILPELLVSNFSIPLYLGGTSLLIMVNVVIDTFAQAQSYLFSQQYESLMKKTKGKRKWR